jgi:hypothetical protein
MGTTLTAVERAWLECCELATEGLAFDAAYADFVRAVAEENRALALEVISGKGRGISAS